MRFDSPMLGRGYASSINAADTPIVLLLQYGICVREMAVGAVDDPQGRCHRRFMTVTGSRGWRFATDCETEDGDGVRNRQRKRS